MREGEKTFMGLLDAGAEEPKSKALRYVVSGVALALLLAASAWYFLRYTPEKRTVERFMHAIVAGDSQQAYQIWHPHPNFSYEDFLSFWGPKGYYSPIKSYRIESAEVPPKGGSGVLIVVEIIEYALGRALRPVDELPSALVLPPGWPASRRTPPGCLAVSAAIPPGNNRCTAIPK
jgi:hypothetical protein